MKHSAEDLAFFERVRAFQRARYADLRRAARRAYSRQYRATHPYRPQPGRKLARDVRARLRTTIVKSGYGYPELVLDTEALYELPLISHTAAGRAREAPPLERARASEALAVRIGGLEEQLRSSDPAARTSAGMEINREIRALRTEQRRLFEAAR